MARELKDKIVGEAREVAKTEGNKIIQAAKETINNEKMAAMTELKNQVATLSIEIAEKVLDKQLSNPEEQKSLVEKLIQETKLN